MRRHRTLRALVAVASAYGLVLQALLLGLVLGLTAAPASSSPTAWAVLCNPSRTVPADAPGAGGAPHAPTCCVAGACGLALGLAGAPLPLLPEPTRQAGEQLQPQVRDLVLRVARGHLPQARAPPLAAA